MQVRERPIFPGLGVAVLLAALLALAACGGNGDGGRTPAGQATTQPSSAGATPDPAGSSTSTVEPAASPTSTVRPPLDATSAETDREALVALYNATDGESWQRSDNWLSDAPIGEWHWVETDENGRVIWLKILDEGLSGEIPPELGNLPYLKDLWLSRNQLSGEIPPELGNLANLKELRLDGNQLSGEIPPELGNLANLDGLFLDGNRLSGCVPQSLDEYREHRGRGNIDLPLCGE